jgi:NADH-quinone oxidoreductase subunit G
MTDVAANPDAKPAVSITVNGTVIAAQPGELVIDACERNGVYIPRFCYHPRMKPVGMCRMCLVNIDTGRGPVLQVSCMIEVGPNMVVDTEAPNVVKAQDGVLEFLLINHPLDCPVCDKGGECPLQDQTMAYGPGESRFVEEKRHFEKPIPISDLIYLDRERCILCDRCTRFAKEVAGDPLIHFLGRGNQTEVNTFPDDPFSSYFSGNTVQICPVGALTAKPYRFKARPWDLEEVASTSVIDSVGSRITVQSSRNVVLRVLGDDSEATNWGWLTDKERFAFEAFNSPARLREPLMRGDALGKLDPTGTELVRATWNQALGAAAAAITAAGPERVAVIGGARLTNEAAFAWAKLAKGIIGTDNVDAQLGDGLPADLVLGLPRATIADVTAKGGIVLLLSGDPKEELGSLFLRLRHAATYDGVTIVELTARATGLGAQVAHSLNARPGELGVLARAIVSGNDTSAAAGVEPLNIGIVANLVRSGRPVTVVLGRPSVAESADVIVDAALALAQIPGVRFLSALRRGNIHGALDMGLAPGLLPGRIGLLEGREHLLAEWPQLSATAGLDTAGILEAAAQGRITTLVLLGADPIRDFPDRELSRRALERVDNLIAIDLFVNESGALADIVLAAAGPTEVQGTFTNLEGRVSPLRQKVTPPGTARADWMIAAELALRLRADLGLESVDQIWDAIVASAPSHAGLTLADLEAAGTEGVLVSGSSLTPVTPAPIALPQNDAYALRLVATRSMYDLGTLVQQAPSLAPLAPGTGVRVHPVDFDKLGLAPGTEVTVTSRRGSVTVAVQPDAGVPRGSAVMVANQPNADVFALIDPRGIVTDVRVERA